MVKLKATNLRTGEERVFTLDDLYGYEGEENGIFLKGKKGEPSWHISFNSGFGMRGMNPEYSIDIVE
jgi:hypothetical protein